MPILESLNGNFSWKWYKIFTIFVIEPYIKRHIFGLAVKSCHILAFNMDQQILTGKVLHHVWLGHNVAQNTEIIKSRSTDRYDDDTLSCAPKQH